MTTTKTSGPAISPKPQGITSIRCCKDCTKRHASCHSHCEDYITEKALLAKYNEDRKREKAVDLYCQTVTMRIREYYSRKPPRYRHLHHR